VLWSTSSLFMRVLQEPTPLGLDDPRLSPLTLAFFRAIFAGACLMPLVRRSDMRFRPAMFGSVLAFGIMTSLYLSALGLGPAANAILLQNTAPVWVYLVGVYILHDPPDRRTLVAILVAVVGALVIVGGNWPRGLPPAEQSAQQMILLMAAGSGVFYAAVILFLRSLAAESTAWVTLLNMFGTAAFVVGFVAVSRGHDAAFEILFAPTMAQLAFVAVFGIVQMAAPYFLFTRGLRTVGPQEAGIITLLEPLLNPVWAYWIAPSKEVPTAATWIGGGLLLAALVWRYWPRTRTPSCSGAAQPSQ
jgi:drug/metabolite transporter, DME family